LAVLEGYSIRAVAILTPGPSPSLEKARGASGLFSKFFNVVVSSIFS
jgi:hypothetical protein